LLTGHSHEPETAYIQQLIDNRIVNIQCGSLYNSRDYYNGYSIISYSSSENRISIYLREYINRSKEFGPATAYSKEEGVITYALEKTKRLDIQTSFTILPILRDVSAQKYRETLLPVIANNSIAPKDILEIFVEPPLYEIPEHDIKRFIKENKVREIDIRLPIENIIVGPDNFIIVGTKESGKTTLLQYLHLKFLTPTKLDSLPLECWGRLM